VRLKEILEEKKREPGNNTQLFGYQTSSEVKKRIHQSLLKRIAID
jgi:hypothetical protein